MTSNGGGAPKSPTSPPAIPATSFASSEAARLRMQRQGRKDTAPEFAVRRAVHARGLRYFVHRRPLPHLRRTADLVFPTERVAVFVDGCFWHGCPEHGRREVRQNSWYWPEKIASNRRRDADTDERLTIEGWIPIRAWEHEIPEAVADAIETLVRDRRQEGKFTHPHSSRT